MHHDTELFWTLLESEHEKLRRFCRRLAGDRDSGDDLCQETLLQGLRRFHTLREHERFRPWLYRIALNRYRNSRRSGVLKWLVFKETEGAHEDPTPRLAARRSLERAMRALSAEERTLVTLFELEGWDVSDLSRLLGRTENAIKVRLCRIRTRLRNELNRTLARREREARESAGKEPVWIAVKSNTD
jgi:RNA polymerase sigma-70 factor (ECF subfamily)